MSSTTTWRVEDAPRTPSDPAHPDAWAVQALCDIDHARQHALHGWTDLWAPLVVRVPILLSDEYGTKLVVVALAPDAPADPGADDVLGVGVVVLPHADNTHVAHVDVVVRPGHEGKGVGTALLRHVEEVAAAHERTSLLAWTTHAPEPPPGPGALEAPTGEGRVPADAHAVRFAQRHGYVLEQVARHSVLTLPGDEDARAALLADARAAAGPEYRTHTWWDTVPDAWLPALAVLWTRMSTDAPNAGYDTEEERWDAERVRHHLLTRAQRHQRVLLTAAEHVPTGTLAAFTVLEVPVPDVPFGFQEDTLVLREHRGRRLGMLVKAVNLDAYAAWRPGERRLHTWNAQENTHMLAINVALGYAPQAVSAGWQRRTT
jgi:GNAT superfamily N-acetyltransferase